MEQELINQATYSPSAVLNLFNNSISIPQTKRIIQLKGVFQQGKGMLYSGFYYDSLRDESSDAQITIAVPSLIRADLQSNKTITVNGFITKRVINNASRIDIQLTVTDLVEQTQNKYAEEDIKKIDLLQAKAAAGFRDVQSYIREKIVKEEVFRIGVIIGKSAIIDSDIKHQLRESIAFYNLSFHRVNLTSETELLKEMDELDKGGFDVIVVSRGGGENLEIFNKLTLAEKSITLRSLFVTAIGHKEDVTLLQKVADKAFITPSEFGQFLNDTFNNTVEDIQHSRAQLVESVKAQLTAGYQKEIQNLNEKIRTLEELGLRNAGEKDKLHQEKIESLNNQIALTTKNYNEQLSETQRLQGEKLGILDQQIRALNQQNQSKDSLLGTYKKQVEDLESRTSFSWTAVIVGIVIGVIIALLIKK